MDFIETAETPKSGAELLEDLARDIDAAVGSQKPKTRKQRPKPAPDPDQAQEITVSAFLGAFFSNPLETINLRAFTPHGIEGCDQAKAKCKGHKLDASCRKLQSDLKLQAKLIALNREHGVYFVVNAGGDLDAEITRYNAFFTEADDKPIEEQHAMLDACPIPPSIRVETRKSVHAYWLIEGQCDESQWREIHTRLIAYFSADPKIKNPARVMRMPGFDHLTKDGDRKRVRVVVFDPEKRYTPTEMLDAFPATATRPKPKAGQTTTGSYPTYDAIYAELGRLMMAHPTAEQNSSGKWDVQGICHNGKGNTGAFWDPVKGRGYCNVCDEATMLRGWGLPEAPTSKKANTNGSSNGANGSSFTTVGNVIFKSTEDGVYAVNDDGDKHWVCSQLSIEADTRNEDGEDWGRLLVVTDRDGVRHEWAMPMTMLAGDGRDYREKLLSLGLSIGAGRGPRQMLEMYLHQKPAKRVRCVDRAGWQDEAYVFPDATLGGADGERIYLQSQAGNNHLIRTAGALKEWQDEIAGYCLNNSMPMFAVSAAFAAPLLRQLQCESGGFNFWGNTSEGKSTLLHAAGSVWGGHADKGYLRRWRATANALETVAKLHNDALLCLDELKECDPRAVELAVYMLSNGQGKIRRQKTDALRPIDEWQLLYLSSGELTLADHLASAGKRVFGGQEVRFIDLRADAGKGHGVFDDLHHFKNGKEFSEHIQQSAKRCYGTAIRAFLSELINQRRVNQARVWYRDYQAKFAKDYLPKDAKPEVARALDRFALVAFAGELASEYGVTTWPKHEATHAAGTVFQRWIEARGTVGQSDEEQAIAIVRGFLEKHGGSRFQKRNNPTKDKDAEVDDLEIGRPCAIINRAGYVDINAKGEIDFYYILPEQFRTEVCAGFNQATVLNALKARGYLKTDNGRHQIKVRAPEGNPRVYAISAQIHE